MALTRRHKLKPFNAEYFSAGGPLFSYRHEWLPAARGELAPAPFCPAPLPARAIAELSLAELLRFFRNPCQGFFNSRLGVHFEEAEAIVADSEPFALDGNANLNQGAWIIVCKNSDYYSACLQEFHIRFACGVFDSAGSVRR